MNRKIIQKIIFVVMMVLVCFSVNKKELETSYAQELGVVGMLIAIKVLFLKPETDCF